MWESDQCVKGAGRNGEAEMEEETKGNDRRCKEVMEDNQII